MTTDVLGTIYTCCDEKRRAALATNGPAGISGIDFVEVRQQMPPDNRTEIEIFLVRTLPAATPLLTGDNIAITGGVRFPDPIVSAQVKQVMVGPTDISGYVVTVPPDQPTDFSTYRLRLVASAGADQPPAFIDARLSALSFSFKADCPSDADCAPSQAEPPDMPAPAAAFDMLAREWDGFRHLMLDRMRVLTGDFADENPVDLTTTIIEALAYRADQQSYRLDWIGTEATLATARARPSVLRHARLVDYQVGEGVSARSFVAFGYTALPLGDGFVLPASTPILPRMPQLPQVIAASDYARMARQLLAVYETIAPLTLWEWRNSIAFHTWSDSLCSLPKGATSATLTDTSGGAGALQAGDFVAFVQSQSPVTGLAADADPTLRHVVRLTQVASIADIVAPGAPGTGLVEVKWSPRDALPFDLPISAEIADPAGGPANRHVVAHAMGNVALVDHGQSLPPPGILGLTSSATGGLRPTLFPATPPPGRCWRPEVRGGPAPLARVKPASPRSLPQLSALALLHDSGPALPMIALHDSFASWAVRSDLLTARSFERAFVVESDSQGGAVLRFGDGENGLAPAVGQALGVTARFGSGQGGNIAPDALAHVVLADAKANAAIQWVSNPLAGTGGADSEPMDSVRLMAPQAFRRPERAVTVEDYAEAARAHPEVSGAMAESRWTGAWQTIRVFIDRRGGLPVDRRFADGMVQHLEFYRLALFDVAVIGAKPAPLDIELVFCPLPNAVPANVARLLRAALSPFGDGVVPGLFHPDNFTFGTPLYLSALTGAAMAVAGVQSVQVRRFRRLGRPDRGELGAGVIGPASGEALTLADNANFPEAGRLVIRAGGAP